MISNGWDTAASARMKRELREVVGGNTVESINSINFSAIYASSPVPAKLLLNSCF